MSDTLARIQGLVESGTFRFSDHAYDKLVKDDILGRDLLDTVATAALIEDYPDYPKGPSVLVLQRDLAGKPIHAVWGIPRGCTSPAVLVTAYRPDPARWTDDFLRRKP